MSKDHTLKGKNRDPPDGAAGILYQGTVTYESWNNSAYLAYKSSFSLAPFLTPVLDHPLSWANVSQKT